MIRRDKSQIGFGKRGRETKAPERTLSSIERLKASGNRWWGKVAKRKRAAAPPTAKSRG